MLRIRPWTAALAVGAAAALSCGGDDTVAPVDAGKDATPDATTADDAGREAAAPEAGADAALGDAADASTPDAPGDAAAPQRLLLSYNGAKQSELVAFDVSTKVVDGRFQYPGFIGTTSATGADPFLMEQATDRVVKLDRAQPWVPRGSWDVKLEDTQDGGAPYSDPNGVIVGAGSKAYVLRYTRNKIAVIDTAQSADAAAPVGTIDLAPFVQPADSDGTVEMTAGVYAPREGLVYVVLGNIDRNKVSSDGFTLLCAQTVSTVVAIDVAPDTLVHLSGGDASGALHLVGTNPVFGGLAHDRAGDRLLIAHAGCNQPADGGAAGPLVKRQIEELSLFTGTSRTLFDATSKGFPSAFVFIDPRHALVQFDFTGAETYAWDPAQQTLGAQIPNAPDAFVYDGAGNLLGLTSTPATDAGPASTDISSVRIADGRRTKLGSNPFSLTGGFVGGIDLWPPRP